MHRIEPAKLRPGVKMTVAEGAYTSLALDALGDRDRAFDALRRIRPTGVEFAMALRDPRFDQMRLDARFRRIASAAGKPAAGEAESNGPGTTR